MDQIKAKCPVFQAGKACPYNVPGIKGLAAGCPEFKEAGCPFKDAANVEEFKGKMGKMRDECKGKLKYDEALTVIRELTVTVFFFCVDIFKLKGRPVVIALGRLN